MNKTHLLVGHGEVGQAIQHFFPEAGVIDLLRASPIEGPIDIMHVCIPCKDQASFVKTVKEYQSRFKPKYTVVHSSVPVGTCRQLNAISSPVLGVHPNLVGGIETFTKFLGGEQASEVADDFRRAGMKVYLFDKPETSELMKILDTTFYGVCLEYTKDVKRQTEKYGVPFEAWTIWTENYNRGYTALGLTEFLRPNLTPIMKKIGGHCVLPNAELIDTKFTKLLKEANG